MAKCVSCDTLVDTDDDADCYYDHHGNDTECRCYWCRQSEVESEEFL